jgi:triosephosphate isomerase
MKRRYLVAGNWKMNGSRLDNTALLSGIRGGLGRCRDVDVLVCPPAVYLDSVKAGLEGSPVWLGAQNLSEQAKPGAFTGEIHGNMLREVGCTQVIVGHSERRSLYAETDDMVAAKFKTARELELKPILCLGETLTEREAGQTEQVLDRQLAAVLKLVGIEAFAEGLIAYEPVWAIGTGRTATPAQAQDAHAFLRSRLTALNAMISDSVRILYGGSVKADNAFELFGCADVDGGLIGGASLKATDFLAICEAAQAHSSS